MWERLAAGYSSRDYGERSEAQKLLVLLLASIGEQREVFEQKLRGAAEDRELASAVLFSSFSSWSLEYTPADQRLVKSALVDAARAWVVTGEPELAQIGGLLLLGHGAWPGVGLREQAAEEEWGARLSALLNRALASAGDIPDWAGLAVGRVLVAEGSRRANAEVLRLPSPEAVGLPRAQVLALFEQTARFQEEVAADRARRHEFLAMANEQTRRILARSLGSDGRDALMRSLESDAPVSGVPGHNPALWEIVTWMGENLEPWAENEISRVLDRVEVDPNAGWQSGQLLDAVVREYPDTHTLSRRARAMFRNHVDQAVALSGHQAASQSDQSRRASQQQMLQQMISHLSDTGPRGGEPSPILAELERADVEALVGGASTRLEQWLGLMDIVGPWPAAVPELERMLAGNWSYAGCDCLVSPSSTTGTRSLARGERSSLRAVVNRQCTPPVRCGRGSRTDQCCRSGASSWRQSNLDPAARRRTQSR